MDWEKVFRERAGHEARRYGADSWVWVRELVQNARDAGASRVSLSDDSNEDLDRVCCRDNGSGMAFSHARQHLFTLYSSSKSGDVGTAGCFGVGFWSVLRFEPTRIVVRSRPAGEPQGWQVVFDQELAHGAETPVQMAPGTEVVLERASSSEDVAARLRSEVEREAGHVTRLGPQRLPLVVTVDGEPCTRPFALDPPCIEFEHRATRGVVALGSEPGVEVFAHGLLVRRAASLDDLLNYPGRRRRRAKKVPNRLAPRVLLDSPRFEVLLSRGDVRQTPELERAVDVARQELARLVNREVDRLAPPTVIGRLQQWVRPVLRRRFVVPLAVLVIFLALGAGLQRMIRGADPGVADPLSSGASLSSPSAGDGPSQWPYHDLRSAYRGPAVDRLEGSPATVALRYEPADQELYLAMWYITGVDGDRWISPSSVGLFADQGSVGESGRVELELVVDASAGLLHLPVPVGHRVVPFSIELENRVLSITGSGPAGGTLSLEQDLSGRLSYSTGPDQEPAQPSPTSWPELPEELGPPATGGMSNEKAAAACAEQLLERVRYDQTGTAWAALQSGSDPTTLFFRVAAAGAGDCDVLSAVLAAMLDELGIEARLAVGYVGRRGVALSGLHAWVELIDESGHWRVIDPSRISVPAAAPAGPRSLSSAPAVVVGSSRLFVGAGVVFGLIGLVLLLLVLRRRPRRRHQAGSGADPVRLIRGVLGDPDAFGPSSAVWHRPLVPTLQGRRLSLTGARRQSEGGRLYRGSSARPLAANVVDQGHPVLDAGDPLSRTVAEHFGAADLDVWEDILAASRHHPLTDLVERLFGGAGGGWKLRLGGPTAEAVTVVEAGETTAVVFDEHSPLWSGVQAAHPPEIGLLLVVDAVARAVNSRDPGFAELVSEVARRAVMAGQPGTGGGK